MTDPAFLFLAAVVFLSYTTQAMTGFGSTVMALTLGAHFYPISYLVPVVVALNLPQCIYMVRKHREHVDRDLLVRGILPWMGLGVVAGLSFAGLLQGLLLKRLFGLLVSAFAACELLRLLSGREDGPPMRLPVLRAWLAAAGVVHGVYASGGPLLTYALSRTKRDKAVFRSTLMSVWLVFNLVLQAAFMVKGRWTAEVGRGALMLLPLLPAGILAGEWLHRRVPERGFRYAVQVLLIVSGAGLLR